MMEETQRLDKWLWYVRLVKSRSMATQLVRDGKVRVNQERVSKPAQTIAPGDVVTAMVHRRLTVLKMRAPGERRGPASEASELYEDLTPPQSPALASDAKPAHPEAARTPGAGRPTKRERRLGDRLRQSGLYGDDG